MSAETAAFVGRFLTSLSALAAGSPAADLTRFVEALADAWRAGATIYTCGNGGSASTATHLAADLAKFEDGVTRLLGGAPTTQNQFDALVSLGYNIGLDEDADTIAEGLGDSSLLRAHKAGDYAAAASKFIAWRFNDGREMRGLKRRREAEAKLYRGEA